MGQKAHTPQILGPQPDVYVIFTVLQQWFVTVHINDACSAGLIEQLYKLDIHSAYLIILDSTIN